MSLPFFSENKETRLKRVNQDRLLLFFQDSVKKGFFLSVFKQTKNVNTSAHPSAAFNCLIASDIRIDSSRNISGSMSAGLRRLINWVRLLLLKTLVCKSFNQVFPKSTSLDYIRSLLHISQIIIVHVTDKNVGRFNVSVNNIFGMNVLNRFRRIRRYFMQNCQKGAVQAFSVII